MTSTATALSEAQQKAAARREAFAKEAPSFARAAGLPEDSLAGVGRLPAWAAWTADGDRVVAMVPEGEPSSNIDRAIAYGLFHAAGRELVLVLPEGSQTPTLIRAAFLRAPIKVHTHAGGIIAPAEYMVGDSAKVTLRESKGLRNRPVDLGPRQAWVAGLGSWADGHASLTPAHRSAYLSWHAFGMQVLKIRPTAGGLAITTGIHFSGEGDNPKRPKPTAHAITSELSPGTQVEIQSKVEAAIPEAEGRKAGPYLEHLLQENFTRQRDRIGWGDGLLLREFPAWRPGGGSGYIDFLRIEPEGQMHIVETKIGADEFVVLQGLDYWIWAQANADLLEEYLKTHNIAWTDTVVDYVLGDKSKPGEPATLLSAYAASHLPLLPRKMRWRVHRAQPLDHRVTLESLPEGEAPGKDWLAPTVHPALR